MDIHLTFDYELYLNDNPGDVDSCLITPTNILLSMLDRHGIKATFFIDMAYIYRLNELKIEYKNLSIDYDKIYQQINDISIRGHEIALHMHPQWFYARYDGNVWEMDFDHYKLSDMPRDKADQMFDICCSMLKDISGYNVKSFRAGGFSIQEYDGFLLAMKRNGLINDSSVLYGEKQITYLHSYDYSRVKSQDIYSFSEDITVPNPEGRFREYPISTLKMPLLTYVCYKLKWKCTAKQFCKWGNGGDHIKRRTNEFKENVKRRIRDGVHLWASADGALTELLPLFIETNEKNNINNLVVLGHPKLFSTKSIKNLENFIIANIGNHRFSVI